MSARGDKFRNRPDEDPSTRRTAEDAMMRGDRGVGQTGGGDTGGSGTGGGGLENEGSGSLLIDDADEAAAEHDRAEGRGQGRDDDAGSGSTKVGPPGGAQRQTQPDTERDRAGGGKQDDNAREGYEDHGSSRDADGTQGESSGSKPGYR